LLHGRLTASSHHGVLQRRRHVVTYLQAFSADDEDYFDGSDEVQGEALTDEELESSMGDWDDKIARFNTVHLTGRIGSDPEPRYFDDGKVVVNLSLANRRKYHFLERKVKNIKSGEEETDWNGLEIWVRKINVNTLTASCLSITLRLIATSYTFITGTNCRVCVEIR